MKHYKQYLILPTDKFDPENFSFIADEILLINEQTKDLPSAFKASILISFMKDHSLQNHWIKQNPELTEMVTSATLPTGSIEALFGSCRDNPVFREDLENYITNLIG